jgi:hypothetical protein
MAGAFCNHIDAGRVSCKLATWVLASLPMDSMFLRSFPAGEWVQRGLDDLAKGEESEAALLVQIAAPRLRRLGFVIADTDSEPAEHRLYARLAISEPDSAHSRYNALIRRLVSFERAFECVK